MATIAEALEQALRFHQTGAWEQAEQIYRQILQADPAHADALHLLGLVAHQRGRHDQAVTYIRQALRANPGNAVFHSNLGLAYQALGKLTDAVASYQEALTLSPDYAKAHHNLGNVLCDQGKLDEAVACYRQALRLNPDYAMAHCHLGNALQLQRHWEEAVACFEQALRLNPRYVEAHNNLGNALRDQGKLNEAVPCYEQALRLDPDFFLAYHNLGNAVELQGKPDEALVHYGQALRLNPDHALSHLHRGLTLLLLGNFEEGWREYEWRWQCKELRERLYQRPLWDGSRLGGRTILLHAEQGLGDTLQFVRYAALVKQRGGQVVVECQPALSRLLASCRGIDKLVTQGSPLPPFDVQASLLSLPRIFGTSVPTVPRKVPYLFAETGLVEDWRQALGSSPARRIGICWQGNLLPTKERAIPLDHFAPVAELPGVQLVSLQKGPGAEQLDSFRERWPITDLRDKLDEASGPFMDTAAVMKNLDLVITCDTSLAHLAGALGVDVWVALHVAPDWRWLLHREESPWYPTMRLFRQTERGNWGEVFERITRELRTKPPASSKGT